MQLLHVYHYLIQETTGSAGGVMSLQMEERSHLLLVGNYLPTLEEIKKVRKKVDAVAQK